MKNKNKNRNERILQLVLFLPLMTILLMSFELKSKKLIPEDKVISDTSQKTRLEAAAQNLKYENSENVSFVVRSSAESIVPEMQPGEKKNREQNHLDTLISGKRLVIKDTTGYDTSFIRGLKSNLGYETIQVFDDSFFYTYRPNTKPDTLVTFKYTIPTNLEQNKEILFSAVSDQISYTLILKRTNYTNIEYQLRQAEKVIKSGTAILQSSFYFGAEVQDDEKGKTIYLRQYLDTNRCGAVIKVEIDHAKIATISWCEDGSPLKWRNLPIFRR